MGIVEVELIYVCDRGGFELRNLTRHDHKGGSDSTLRHGIRKFGDQIFGVLATARRLKIKLASNYRLISS